MGDVGDMYRDVREYKQRLRRELGRDCIGCVTHYPKRSPSILLPGQTCRVCGHKDLRTRGEA